MDYKSSGVDIEAGYRSVELIKESVKSTFRKEVLNDIGGFGGLFSISDMKNMDDPVLVSGTDGVGTKLKIAFLMDKHDTIGIDAVAMCVNDIICTGAEPLFYLDYIACGKNKPEKIAQIVKGIADGCKISKTALIGGETAEMPGFYPEDEYDLAGFAVGILDRSKIIDGKKIKQGDILIGLASNGIHSNGYSLVRNIFNPSKENLHNYIDDFACTLGEELLKPTKIYVKSILNLITRVEIKGITNITGGGFIENIPRVMPTHLKPRIRFGTWEVLPIFTMMEKKATLDKISMFNTFNMGIGMVLVVDEKNADETVNILNGLGEKAYVIGDVVEGENIDICLE